MQFSPRCVTFHRKLYRNRRLAVTLAALSLLANPSLQAQGPLPRYGHKPVSGKEPRALGLIQLSSKGKARLTPIAILMDGKFYDAGSYKAAPVPMALDFGIVYEGFRAGVSQGVFTITQPGQLNHTWIAEGTWFPAGTKAPETGKKYSTPVIEDKDAPPVLHRRSGKDDSDSSPDKKDADKTKDAGTKDAGKDKDKDKNDSNKDQPKPAPAPPAAPTPSLADAPPVRATNENIADPNRPTLRRGKPESTAHLEPYATFEAMTGETPGKITATGKADAKAESDPGALPQFTFVAAISDSAGPDARPYIYDVKPAEEAVYKAKMLDFAAAQLRGALNATIKGTGAGKSNLKSGTKLPKPAFDDAILHIFDLSNSNQPVLILSAKTHPAAGANGDAEPKEIMLIARTNLDGDLQKLFFSQTDSKHLDINPRMELIDAVDADGDGRGELLFRRTTDAGSAFAIYRVTSDRLFPLFEGTP